jgi:hypothetical protein
MEKLAQHLVLQTCNDQWTLERPLAQMEDITNIMWYEFIYKAGLYRHENSEIEDGQVTCDSVMAEITQIVINAERKRYTEMLLKYCHACNNLVCQNKREHAICKACNHQGATIAYPLNNKNNTDSFRTKCGNCGSHNFYTF